jgi:hypothetical protein
VNLEFLTADQDEDSGHQCEHARQNADAEAGEREDTYGDQINRKQKHTDVFGNHGAKYRQLSMGLTMLNRGRQLFSKLLPAANADYDRRDIFQINESVEVFRARKIGKVDDAVGHLRHFAAHFFSRAQV